jgi:predicted nuclease of predicted toxin-antitoxin system
VDSHLLRGRPEKLRLITTGNMTNRELQALITPLIPDIVREFEAHSFLEIGRSGVEIRGEIPPPGAFVE